MNMPIKIDDRTASFFRLHSDATFLRHEMKMSTAKAIEQRPATTIGMTNKGLVKWLPFIVIKPTVEFSALDVALDVVLDVALQAMISSLILNEPKTSDILFQ